MDLKSTAVYNMNLHLLPPDVSMLPACEAETVHNSGTINQKTSHQAADGQEPAAAANPNK